MMKEDQSLIGITNMSTAPQKRWTLEEYLAWEDQQETRHEFCDGQIIAMAGSTYSHGRICGNLHYIIAAQSDQTGCEALGPDQRVRCPRGMNAYPDIVVVCENPVFADNKELTLLNPKMIFEVLSPSTTDFDRGEKLLQYQSIQSLTRYLLVSQNRSLVEIYSKQPNNEWVFSFKESGSFELPGSRKNINIAFAELYKGVKFSKLELFRSDDPDQESHSP